MHLFKEGSKRGKDITWLLLFLLSAFIFSYCEDETAEPRSYPRVNSMPVSDISSKGATFNAVLYSMGSEPVIQHGFVWGTIGELDINSSNRVLLGPSEQTGKFSSTIVTSLVSGLDYVVEPFVQSSDHIVYGITTKFRSLGSGAPKIDGFYPHSAGWLDTIVVKGKNFSWIAYENIVSLNQTQCITVSSTDTTLKVVVNMDLADLKSVMSVGIAGNTSLETQDTFKLIAPVIRDFYPKQIRWGDTLFVKGKYLKYLPLRTGNWVKVGTLNCNFLGIVKDSIIAVRIPNEVISITNTVSAFINGINISNTSSLNLLPPLITSFYPKKGLRNSIVTFFGKFNPLQARNQIGLNNIPASITYCSRDSIKLRIPSGTSDIINIFNLKSPPFESTFNDLYEIVHPVINSINPLSAGLNDELTILGENLTSSAGATSVKLGSLQALIKSSSDNKIIFYVPYGIDTIPKKVEVTVGTEIATSGQSFSLAKPEIISVSPSQFSYGDEITVSGKGFGPGVSYNKLFIGIYPLTILSATTTEIKAKITSSIPRGYYNLILNYGNYTRIFPLNFEFKSKWLAIPFPSSIYFSPSYEDFRRSITFSVNGKGYFIDYYSQKLISFDPSLNTFTDLGKTTFSTYGSNGVVNGDVFYLIGGNIGVYRFNSSDNSWTSLAPLSIYKSHGMAFSINGKIYYGLTQDYMAGTWDKNIWIYDPVKDSWSVTSTFPFSSVSVEESFALNNKGYVLFKDKKFYEYNPETNIWTEKKAFPASARIGVVHFTIGNVEYIGLGRDAGVQPLSYDDFYVYDPASDTWTQANYLTADGKTNTLLIPGGGRHNAIIFTINDKIYMGLGFHYTTTLLDFYEYDPTYSLK